MLRKIFLGLALSILGFALVGCGTSSKAPQQNTEANQAPSNNAQQQNSDPNASHLVPVPSGTPLVSANQNVSKQLMEQKDVVGTQIYEQLDTVYGDIKFKTGVDKNYAHALANEFMTQLKVTYPNRQITTQAISDEKVIDSITFKP